MKRLGIMFFAVILFINIQDIFGQNNRLNTNNDIEWYNYFGTFKVSEKFGIHTEYQWRRNNLDLKFHWKVGK